MPLYEYVCQECEEPFEALVFGNEEAECPRCHGRRLARQLSVPARPKAEATALPSACNSTGPPCGPVCGRWNK